MLLLSPKNLSAVFEPSEVIQNKGPLLEDIGTAATPAVSVAAVATAVQSATFPVSAAAAATPGVNFEGLGVGTPGYTVLVSPPDTTLAVGPNHVVQWVNTHIAIYDKSGNPLLPSPGFVAGNTLWSGFGGLCESTNRGDPLVVYDQRADRWVFSQFAFDLTGSSPSSPYLQCFAVSQGSNPAGPYFRYAYTFTDFNDYGKIGVWTDHYLLTYNSFRGSPAGSNNGAIICAMDRTAMLTGQPAPAALCAPTNFYAGGTSLLPSDLEGRTALPPVDNGSYLMRQSTAPAFRYLRASVNFNANTITLDAFPGRGFVFGSFMDVPIALTRACNGGGGTCIPQPGTTTQLDTLGDRLMYRLGYRNRGGVESLVVSMAEDPDGAGAQRAAIRWAEFRNIETLSPTLFQNATYNPNSTNRWMSSMAMDKNGNIGIGYSLASATVFPSIAVTGRLRSEVRNRLQPETIVINGTGSQTVRSSGAALTRWGDYSTMRVDPVDDCTFWFTTEYIAANGVFNWRTRINSFKFPNCQ